MSVLRTNEAVRPSGQPWREWLGDAARALPFVLGALIVSEREARAYTDPGTGALIWQTAVAGFIGLMFYLRRFTSWFKARKTRRTDE